MPFPRRNCSASRPAGLSSRVTVDRIMSSVHPQRPGRAARSGAANPTALTLDSLSENGQLGAWVVDEPETEIGPGLAHTAPVRTHVCLLVPRLELVFRPARQRLDHHSRRHLRSSLSSYTRPAGRLILIQRHSGQGTPLLSTERSRQATPHSR